MAEPSASQADRRPTGARVKGMDVKSGSFKQPFAVTTMITYLSLRGHGYTNALFFESTDFGIVA